MPLTSVGAAAVLVLVLAGVVVSGGGAADCAPASARSKTPEAARTPVTNATETAPMIRKKRFEARGELMAEHPTTRLRSAPEPALMPSLKLSVSALRREPPTRRRYAAAAGRSPG